MTEELSAPNIVVEGYKALGNDSDRLRRLCGLQQGSIVQGCSCGRDGAVCCAVAMYMEEP
jgi:hypothetical protein